MQRNKPILLVEDDSVDALTVKRAVRDVNISNPIVVTRHGEEALEYLRNETPCLILTDLNMPKMNGLELIKTLKSDPNLRRIPVIVLTTSREEKDRQFSFDHSVAGYIIKPVDYVQFVEAMRALHLYWTTSELL